MKRKGSDKKKKSSGARNRNKTNVVNSGTSSTNPNRVVSDVKKKGIFYRTKSKINLLNLYNTKIDPKSRKKQSLQPARIEPDRKWFGNTRLITQNLLQKFRQNFEEVSNDPYKVLIKRTKIPISLFDHKDESCNKHSRLLDIEPFSSTFGKGQIRKRPKIEASDFSQFCKIAEEKEINYQSIAHEEINDDEFTPKRDSTDEIFKRGTSKRIWGELYKVIDSSDIIVEVLDCRDPMGTRCRNLENFIKKNKTQKHLVLLLNKCDLVPSFITKNWLSILSKEYPTVAFHAKISNPFGKNALFQLLRQYGKILSDRKHVSVGFIGYPNVGKSSVINTLRRKKVCMAAPIPGETKVWQYINLTNKIYLIDCPGIVPSDYHNDDEFVNSSDKLLKGAIRAERIKEPELYIGEILKRVEIKHLQKRYKIGQDACSEPNKFLEEIAVKMGKLLKGGNPDISTAARIVLYDWQRGRLPYFVPPEGLCCSSKDNDKERFENSEETCEVNSPIGDNDEELKIAQRNDKMST